MDKRLLAGGVVIAVVLVGAWVAHDPSSDVVKLAWRSLPGNGGHAKVTVPRYRPWSKRQQRRPGDAQLPVMQVARDALLACGVGPDTSWSWRGVLHLDGSPEVDVEELPEDLASCARTALGVWPLAEEQPEGVLIGLAWRGTLAEVQEPWFHCRSSFEMVAPVRVSLDSPVPDGVMWRVDLEDGALDGAMAWPPGEASAPASLPFQVPADAARDRWRCFFRGEMP